MYGLIGLAGASVGLASACIQLADSKDEPKVVKNSVISDKNPSWFEYGNFIIDMNNVEGVGLWNYIRTPSQGGVRFHMRDGRLRDTGVMSSHTKEEMCSKAKLHLKSL